MFRDVICKSWLLCLFRHTLHRARWFEKTFPFMTSSNALTVILYASLYFSGPKILKLIWSWLQKKKKKCNQSNFIIRFWWSTWLQGYVQPWVIVAQSHSSHYTECKCFGNWPRSLGSAPLHQSGFLKAGCNHRRCKLKNDPKDSHNSDGF